ncbi:hypothetical protein KM043_010548 [Ampulex compressa]|nr:hypothetical protein KM043_010548 [Ampulex compressa]
MDGIETPMVKLSEEERETVYDPSEDSFLLIDAIESNLSRIFKLRPALCLEIGSGSGVVISALAKTLNRYVKGHYMAVDINQNACRVTKRTASLNSVEVDVLQMDLVSCIRPAPVFDIILFNPPYVVTDDAEVSEKDLMSKAWAGGENGRRVMERIFQRIPELLSSCGLFYLVVIEENDPEYIIGIFKQMNIGGSVVCERKIRGEHLYVLSFASQRLSSKD